jgi:hypothetical protein
MEDIEGTGLVEDVVAAVPVVINGVIPSRDDDTRKDHSVVHRVVW